MISEEELQRFGTDCLVAVGTWYLSTVFHLFISEDLYCAQYFTGIAFFSIWDPYHHCHLVPILNLLIPIFTIFPILTIFTTSPSKEHAGDHIAVLVEADRRGHYSHGFNRC